MATDKISKSARKRETHALQALGEELLKLTDEQLANIAMADELRDAVLHARKIKSHGALRRQKQLIGKLMRRADVTPIRAAITALQAGKQREIRVFRDAEAWRDRVVAEGPAALDDFFASCGMENAALLDLTRTLERTSSDRKRKELKRQIFREIHRDLNLKMQNAAI